MAGILSTIVARNAWINNYVCLCVMEAKSCVEQWMVEEATTLKKVSGMDEGW
jgi:hypothetical protein